MLPSRTDDSSLISGKEMTGTLLIENIFAHLNFSNTTEFQTTVGTYQHFKVTDKKKKKKQYASIFHLLDKMWLENRLCILCQGIVNRQHCNIIKAGSIKKSLICFRKTKYINITVEKNPRNYKVVVHAFSLKRSPKNTIPKRKTNQNANKKSQNTEESIPSRCQYLTCCNPWQP